MRNLRKVAPRERPRDAAARRRRASWRPAMGRQRSSGV